MTAITANSQAISTSVRRVVAAAGIGLAILVPTYAAIELTTAPTPSQPRAPATTAMGAAIGITPGWAPASTR